MSQFTLRWSNERVLLNPNANAQRALYRIKSVGGAFISTGFTPTNDLALSAITSDTPNTLPSNKVIEFKIQAICNAGGPTDNDNGIVEGINFSCITPSLVQTDVTATATLSLVGTDVTKIRFTLKKSSDNTTVASSIVNVVSNSAAYTVSSGVTPSTNYYWQVELYATVNNIEIISSSPDNLGIPCSPYPFTTNAPLVCNPSTAGTISSVEIP